MSYNVNELSQMGLRIKPSKKAYKAIGDIMSNPKEVAKRQQEIQKYSRDAKDPGSWTHINLDDPQVRVEEDVIIL